MFSQTVTVTFDEHNLRNWVGAKKKTKVELESYTFIVTNRLAQFSSALLSVREVWGSIPGSVKSDTVSPTVRHRCDVSWELCCTGAKPQR